jgi:hypothetical protein
MRSRLLGVMAAGLLLGACGTTHSAATSTSTTSFTCSTLYLGTHCYKPPPTTTTTLPPPLGLGTTTTLSSSSGSGIVSVQVTINHVWTNATPQLEVPGYTLSQLVSGLLHFAKLPPGQPLTWIGVDVSIANTGQAGFVMPGTAVPLPALTFVVNGDGNGNTFLTDLAFRVGVPGCPFPFTAQAEPAVSVSGCVAFAVPAGVTVSTVGLALGLPESGPPRTRVAYWRV